MVDKGKIFFFITSSDNLAKGGHFRSCLTIARSLGQEIDIEIINIGKILSPVFCQDDVKVTFRKITLINFINQILSVAKYVKKGGEVKLIAFDFFAFFFIRNISLLLKVPIAFVRCGGKNPTFSPFSQTVFSFSKENDDYFRSNTTFDNSNLILVPNRIQKISSTSDAPSIESFIGNRKPIILRIGRLVANYKEVNEAALKLSSFLSENEVEHNLVFIGYPDSENSPSYVQIKDAVSKNSNVFLLETKVFTSQASLFLKEASLVIGTGRGAMESIVESVPLAIFSTATDLPVIVDSDYIFDIAFAKNFSKRVRLQNVSSEGVQNSILAFFKERDIFDRVLSFQQNKKKYFDIDLARELYLNAFAKMKYDNKIRIVDYIKHLKIFVFKLYYMSTRVK